MTTIVQSTSVNTAVGTVHSASLPGAATAGRGLVSAITVDKNASTLAVNTGWTIVRSYIGPSVSTAIAYKAQAAGTSADTVTWTSGNANEDAEVWIAELDANDIQVVGSASANSNDLVVTSQSTGTTPADTPAGFAVAAIGADTANVVDLGGAVSNGFTLHLPFRSDRASPGLAIAVKDAVSGAVETTYSTTDTGDQMCGMVVVVAPAAAYTAATVLRGEQGAATASGFVASVELDKASTARLVTATTSDLATGRATGPAATAKTWHKLDSASLSANTLYHWGVEVDNGSGGWTLDPTWRGQCRTFPTAGQAANVRLTAGSCAMGATGAGTRAATAFVSSVVFDRIAARAPNVHLDLGDRHYQDEPDNDPASFRAATRGVLDAATQKAMRTTIPTAYIPSDHDSGVDNASSASASMPAFHAEYRETYPHYPLAIPGTTTPIAQAFWLGRVLVVMLDTRTHRVAGSARLGTDQLNWLLSVINGTATVQGLSTGNAKALILCSDVGWLGGASTDDWWGEAATERATITQAVADAGRTGSTMIVHGDAHSVQLDDGTNNTYATGYPPGFRNLGFAPIHRTASFSTRGGPYSHGTYTEHENQYGVIDITDDGSTITFTATGYRADTDAVLGAGAATMTWSVSATTPPPPDLGPISGATGATYTLQPEDEGFYVYARVTATNVVGAVTADSALVGPIAAAGGTVNVTDPTLQTDSPTTGVDLVANAGTWSGPGTTVASWEYE